MAAPPTSAETAVGWIIIALVFAPPAAAVVSALVEIQRRRPLPMGAHLRQVRNVALHVARVMLLYLLLGELLEWSTRWSVTTLLAATLIVTVAAEVLVVVPLRRAADHAWPPEPEHAGIRAGLGLPFPDPQQAPRRG